jgi:hypothetical protein
VLIARGLRSPGCFVFGSITAPLAVESCHLLPRDLAGILPQVGKQHTEKKRPTVQDIWRLFLAVVGVIAIVGELRKPANRRTWHGTVAGFIPYDFRMPTADRLRDTYWNPAGPVISSKFWGVGWSPNFGALKRFFTD